MTLEQPSVNGQIKPSVYNLPLGPPSAQCRCSAHVQHRVFKYLWDHPGISLKIAAEELHLSYTNVRMTKSRLMRRHDLSRLCPECFKASLQGLACTSCGFEADTPRVPLEISFASQSPVHSIQPMNGLGSQTNYNRLKLQYGGTNIRHWVESKTVDDPLLERCKSDLWEALKGPAPSDRIVEEATRLLIKEVKEFEYRYADLVHSTKAKAQLVKNVLYQINLRYPFLRRNIVTFDSKKDVLNGEEDNE